MSSPILNQKNKTKFFPYDKRTTKAYFIYLGLCMLLVIFDVIFCLFAAINVGKYHLYDLPLVNFNYSYLNLFCAPIVCLVAIFVSMVLLTIAPKVSTINSKKGSIMFYWAFWLLIISTMLSMEIQLTYISHHDILYHPYYHWIDPLWARIVMIPFIFLLVVVQVYFWIMRRKFTFMNSDYEIYTNRSMLKKQRKIKKQELKKLKQVQKIT